MTLTSDQSQIEYPFVIETDQSYDRAPKIAEDLFFKTNRSQLEDQVLDVWVKLIEIYEEDTYGAESGVNPVGALTSLMEARDLVQADLVRAGIGTSGVISEILSSKRAISEEQAKKLGEIFQVSPFTFSI